MRFFNTTGICVPEDHYMIDPLTRIDTKSIMDLFEKKLYFIIHAPRQTGKTTYLYALEKKLNKMEEYVALTFSIESASYEGIDVNEGMRVIISSLYSAAENKLKHEYLPVKPEEFFLKKEILKEYLETWAEKLHKLNKKLILLIDESDSLKNDDLFIAFFRQLRNGFMSRPEHFPSSIVLVGLRDIRDYKTKVRIEKESFGTASPFNIKARAFFMKPFTKEETYELLSQHERETGQVFENHAKHFIFNQTSGQPWLVNAIANQIVSEIFRNDISKKITLELAEQAKREIILRRDTHIDSLLKILQHGSVKNVVQSIIAGEVVEFDSLDDDISYTADLGIITRETNRNVQFANKIYAEIIPRVMAHGFQLGIGNDYGDTVWYVKKNGSLDMDKLLKKFQEFYRENSESWLDRYVFKEAGHQLIVMAFLQRIINAGGEINREMAIGNGRTDLLVIYKGFKYVLELKLYKNKKTRKQGMEQISRYLDQLGMDSGYLLIFDTRRRRTWKQKLYLKKLRFNSKKITIVGL